MGESPPLALTEREQSFTWRDGERLVRFGPQALAEAPDLLRAHGFGRYTLLTTPRGHKTAPRLAGAAERVLDVPAGQVPQAAATVRHHVEARPLVALGGGRVIDVAKAIGAAERLAVAAVPTTLSGAEMTTVHRLPEGVERAGRARPRLVVADPEVVASQPLPALAASAMNALGHAAEALYTPLANPIAETAALRAAELIGGALGNGASEDAGSSLLVQSRAVEAPARAALALGSLLAAYALDSAGIAVHHVVCQSIVRLAGTPHAETNAVMLPHTLALVARREPPALGRLAVALGAPDGDPAAAPPRVARLARLAGPTRLGELGVALASLDGIAEVALGRPELASTPDPPERDELRALLGAAL